MGIKRLYSYLGHAFETKNIKDLSGIKIGIDAMGWLYQAFFGTPDEEQELRLSLIRNIELKIRHLKKAKLSFVFVIDGKQLVCKEKTRMMRDKKREMFSEKSLKMEQQNYDVAESQVYQKYSQKISPEILYFFIDYLIFEKYQFIVAPYESDSQLYYMYKHKQIDYIMSEDSDIAAHGCMHIIKNYKKSGECLVMNETTIGNLRTLLKDI